MTPTSPARPPSSPAPDTTGYRTRQVARLLDLSEARIRAYEKEGFVHPGRGVRGELRFTFQHLVLLRTAKELLAVRSPAKVKRALNSLRRQLPTGRDLASLRITAQGDEIIATDDGESWIPSSGQTLINFKTADIAASVAPLAKEAEDESPLELVEEALTAEDWYELGCELEPVDHEQAREAYRRVLEYHPDHPDAHVNLGRILHELKRQRR